MLPVLAEYTPAQLQLVEGMVARLIQAITDARNEVNAPG
jgi:hypothetical protein